jgi:hypothetical protein
MRILRIYKGMLPGSVTVPVYYPATERGYDLGYGEIDPGQTELFFLKKDVSGQLGFYSHYNFGFPLSDTRPEVPAGSPPQSALEAELMCTATTGPDQIAQNAMRALWTNPDGTRLAKTIAQNPRYSQGLQAIAVGYLVKAHVPGAVDTDIRFLKSVRQKKTDPNAIVLAAGPIEARGDLPLRQAWELVGLRMVEVDRFLAIMIRASGRRDFAPVAMEILQHSRDQRAPDDAAIYLARLRHDPKMYSGRVTPARVQEYLKWWNTEGRAKYGAAG